MAAEEGQVFVCHTLEEWENHLQRGVESNKLVVIDFTAAWCGPCRFISPIFAEIAKKTANVIFLKVDVDELAPVAKEFKVEAMPTFLFLKVGREVDRIVGARKEELMAKVNLHGSVTTA
ncbi:Thioredoxin H-type [Dorcoceras hygrometricum]|uniref:Thioredoxin H-type n=1 Tax=Dorcoceras hygrometricum TaxID=472368 RepID=A0A2Z7B4Z0_9LAMI|nr:Thioredoxin H-type [Dorcoceras hygrometricum]